jgi:Tfp pilus tip-associated adhesin PilY1
MAGLPSCPRASTTPIRKSAAALFLLSLDKPAGEAWKQNTNYYKIVLPAPVDKNLVNALSTPGDYAGADGATRFLYAGDTQGNLWKFDFSGNAPWNGATALALNGPADGRHVRAARMRSGSRSPSRPRSAWA